MVFIGAPGAILDGGKVNRYAFTGQAVNVRIKYLTIQNFGTLGDNNNEGVVNHDGGSGWTIEYNTVQANGGAGIFLGSNNTMRYNCVRENGQYGFSMYRPEGLRSIVIDHNEIAGNNTYDWEAKISGCGCTGGGKFWDAQNVTVTNNWVHHNKSVGLWADTNDIGFLIDGNYINDNDDEGIFYEISYNAKITNNTLIRNAIVKGKAFAARNDNFPIVAIYISESGGDSRVNGGVYSTMEIAGNNLVDNWGGIGLWENADRFCGSAANTSAGYCTAVNPAVTLNTCVAGTIDSAPYLSDCRWKTQNVSVHTNRLSFSRANVGCTTTGCGQQGVLSNWGTYPSWSPYKASMIQDAITFSQNNRFANNTYIGDWRFTARETSNFVSFATWQGTYGQDGGSSLQSGGTTPTTVAPVTTTSIPSTTTSTIPSTTTSTIPATTTTTTPAVPTGNALNADTAGLEGSVGAWTPWFSSTISRSGVTAHTGAGSLRVDVTAPYGWGVQLNNYPGFATTAGNKTLRFWGQLGAGSTTGATMKVTWRDSAGSILRADTVSVPALTTTWQLASASVVAPTGTATAWVELSGNAAAGTTVYLDDLAITG